MYKLHCSQHAGSLPLFDWGVGCQGNSESVQIFEANYRMLCVCPVDNGGMMRDWQR